MVKKFKVLFYNEYGTDHPIVKYYKTWKSAVAAAKKHREKGKVACAEVR